MHDCLLVKPMNEDLKRCQEPEANHFLAANQHPPRWCSLCPASPAVSKLANAHQLISSSVKVLVQLGCVQVARDMAELDPNLCCAALEGFASLEQEGDAIPSGVVDEHGHRTEGRAPTARQSRWLSSVQSRNDDCCALRRRALSLVSSSDQPRLCLATTDRQAISCQVVA